MNATCPLCDRQSLLFYPVRYAVACPRGAAKAPGLSGHFKIDGRAPQSVATAKYTLRALRPGYLYTYDERRRRLRAYVVLEDGILWSFPPSTTPKTDAEDLRTRACANAGDFGYETLGRCVDIEYTPGCDNPSGMNFWIGWSNVRWTKDLVFNKINDASWRKQHMQCVEVAKVLAGAADHAAGFEASYKQIAHFSMNEQAMNEAFGYSNRAPKSEIRQGKGNLPPRIIDAMRATPNKQGFIVATDDPVGMTNDLAELTVPNLNNGFDEKIYWKWMSSQLLERAESGIRSNAKAMTEFSYASSAAVNMANGASMPPTMMSGDSADVAWLYRVTKGWIKTGNWQKAVDDDDRRSHNVPDTAKDAAEDAWEDASTVPDPSDPTGKRRKSVIDKAAIDNFVHKEYPQALEAFKPKWQPLVQAHADWLKSQLLADWMTGVHDTKDIRSGYAYSESCAQAIGTAIGTDECKKILDDWLNGRASDTRNLYARALMFNHEELMKAADAQVHGSDIQYENFLNIYKEAYKQVEKLGNTANLRDRLVVATACQIVGVLTKGVRGAAVGFVTIRLSMQAGVRIKADQVSQSVMRNWLLDQGKALGLEFDGSRVEQQAAAANVSRKVLKAAPPTDSSVLMYELDTDALVQSGTLDASEVKAIKVPGVEVTKKWLGSGREFNLGIVTAIFQMATIAFAFKDWKDNDQFNSVETSMKFYGSGVAFLGNLIETTSETIKNIPEHPLAAFLMKQWPGTEEEARKAAMRAAEQGAKFGRGLGAATGLVLAGFDLIKNMPEAYKNKEYGLAVLYGISGTLGIYIAVCAYLQIIPGFWIAFVLSILVGIAIAIYKAAAMKDWVSRCKFSTAGEHYESLDAEVRAFNSAAGG